MKLEMDNPRPGAQEGGKQGGDGWLWMLLCCIPMIALIVLAVLGVWSAR